MKSAVFFTSDFGRDVERPGNILTSLGEARYNIHIANIFNKYRAFLLTLPSRIKQDVCTMPFC
jgi:hypothetical protein